MKIFLVLALLLFSFSGFAQEQNYKITLLRVNPGDLLKHHDTLANKVK